MDRQRDTLQFTVHLRDVEPAIWRRIEVPASYTFWDLHVAIQDAMGWQDCHLHAFRVPAPEAGSFVEIGIPDDEGFIGGPEYLPGWEVPVTAYLSHPGDQAGYEYDFGDGWEHHLVLEQVAKRRTGTRYPRCLAGARACPPEDCGGPGGFAQLLETIADPAHEEHQSTLMWLGGRFDPAQFDPERVRFDNPRRRWRTAFGGE